MYFYIIDGNGNIVEDKFTINNDGKRLIVNKLKWKNINFENISKTKVLKLKFHFTYPKIKYK